MFFTRFAVCTSCIAILLALAADITLSILAARHGAYVFGAGKLQWLFIIILWLGLSVLAATAFLKHIVNR
jgi:hypothetical protein